MDDLVEMCEREHPRLVGMLALYCGDRDAAEDLAQEALVKLCRDWRKVRTLDAPDRWIHRVAINLAHSHFRRKRLEERVKAAMRPRTSDVPETDIEALELLRCLPHRQKTALILHYYLDLPVREVAVVMDIPEGTAKTHIHRARKALSHSGIQEVHRGA